MTRYQDLQPLEPGGAERRKVFVVDDDPLVVRSLRGALPRLGWEVCGDAPSTAEALAGIANAEPDVVLVDIGLGGGPNGIALATQLLPTNAVPLVFISGADDLESLRRAARTQASGFLSKPLDPHLLAANLEMARLRHEASCRLRAAHQELELAQFTIEHAVDAFHLLSAQGKLLRVNAASCRILGYERDELEGASIWLVDPGFSSEQWASHWDDLRARGSVTLERALRRKTGELVPVEITANLLRFRGRELSAAVVRDISDRKRAEAELRATRDHYQSLFDEAIEGVFRTELDGTIVDVNPAFARITGHHSPADLRGTNAADLYASSGEYRRVVPGVARRTDMHDAAAKWRRRDGEIVTVEIHGRVLTDSAGRLSHYQGFVRDVTVERARAARERALLDHKEQLELVIEGTRLGFWDWNPSTGDVVFNSQWAEMLGYAHDELEPRIETCRRLVHPEDLERCEAGTRAHLAGETPFFEVVHRMRHRDGRWVHVLNRGKVFARDSNGRVTRFCGTHTDITPQKEAEQAALDANRAKTHFMANMSHELRTPLNAVLGLTEGLLDGAYGALDDGQRRALTTVFESGQLLLSLIGDILDIARVEAGQLALVPSDVALHRLLYECVAIVVDSAADRGLRVVVESSEAPSVVRGDPRRLKQLLLNLLTNAIKFGAPHGTVWVGARSTEGLSVELWVRDDGPGIPREDLERIFEPFVTLRHRAPDQEGAGLGLALAKRIVELHAGSIRVESEPGTGSKFVVVLPAQPAVPAEARAGSDVPAADRSRTTSLWRAKDLRPPLLLLVEDNAANAQAIGGYLETQGYRVRVARDGTTGAAWAADDEVALVIMDIHLPSLSGLDAIGRIRATEASSRTPILAVTACAMPGDEERCLAAGASAFLAKPVGLKRLMESIGSLLVSSRKSGDVRSS